MLHTYLNKWRSHINFCKSSFMFTLWIILGPLCIHCSVKIPSQRNGVNTHLCHFHFSMLNIVHTDNYLCSILYWTHFHSAHWISFMFTLTMLYSLLPLWTTTTTKWCKYNLSENVFNQYLGYRSDSVCWETQMFEVTVEYSLWSSHWNGACYHSSEKMSQTYNISAHWKVFRFCLLRGKVFEMTYE